MTCSPFNPYKNIRTLIVKLEVLQKILNLKGLLYVRAASSSSCECCLNTSPVARNTPTMNNPFRFDGSV
jgi:hypothetical protein